MKALILTSSSNWGGTEVHTLALAATLADRGHAVNILSLGQDAFRKAPSARDSGVTLSHLALPGPLRKLSLLTWKKCLGGLDADVAIFPKGHVNCGSLALDLAARWRFGCYMTIEHLMGPPLGACVGKPRLYGMIPGLPLWWYRQWLRYHARGLGPRKIICVSEAVKSRLTQDYRWPARKVLVVRNGIDTARFRPDARLRAATRRLWGIAADALVCGVVSRLAPEKGCEVALECFKRLRIEGGRTPHLVFVGDGPMAAELRRAVEHKGLRDSVVFAGRTDRPWEAYPAVDVLLMPSRVEGLPLGLLEAMACGCCPVAMGVGGIPEVLTETDHGWLVAPDDTEGFVSSLEAALAAGPEKRSAIGKKARAHVQAHFNGAVQFAALASIIENEGNTLRADVVTLPSGGRKPPEISRTQGTYGPRSGLTPPAQGVNAPCLYP